MDNDHKDRALRETSDWNDVPRDHGEDGFDLNDADSAHNEDTEDNQSREDEENIFVEPSYDRANSLPFSGLVERLEGLSKLDNLGKSKMIRKSREEKLIYLLPPRMLEYISTSKPSADANGAPSQPQSVFPLYRLLIPSRDSTRRLFVKEAALAAAYTGAFPWNKNSGEGQKLHNYSNPEVAVQGTGDFSMVLYHVLRKRLPSEKFSKVSIGKINKLLDDLASFSTSNAKSSLHDWNKTRTAKASDHRSKVPLTQQRVRWVEELKRLQLSRLEHKWLVRIILQDLKIHIGADAILAWYHVDAPALWSGHNSLKGILNELCQSHYQSLGSKHRSEDFEDLASNLPPYLRTESITDVQLDHAFTPMLSHRTGFDGALHDLSIRHRSFAMSEECHLQYAAKSLAIQHPAFAIENKLDGERMIVHYHANNGTVTIHSRKGNYYSDLYTPVLGPGFRQAVGHLGLDFVLDGEIVSWDDGKKEIIEFGFNRQIARGRKRYLERENLLDYRDLNPHGSDETDDMKRMTSRNTFTTQKIDLDFAEEANEECWLQYVAFDIVYVGGSGAKEFLEETVSPWVKPRPEGGSIVALDVLERKKILYKALRPVEHVVEVVETLVVRSDGTAIDGAEYFGSSDISSPSSMLAQDSISAVYNEYIEEIGRVDNGRRRGRSDDQISQARAHAIDRHYRHVVEDRKVEGLLLKDLSTPYVLALRSKTLRFWHKFKPDYFYGSDASDIDVVIVGAFFATGLRLAGRPSSFLCACLDSNDNESFLTMCKVNAASAKTDILMAFLDETGFRTGVEGEGRKVGYGRWRESDGTLPDFLSLRSLQTGADGGWKARKQEYPDLWISPSDSCVLTLNAADIIRSEVFAAGLTLRFPRIAKFRRDGDEKDPRQIQTDTDLVDILERVETTRAHASHARDVLDTYAQEVVADESSCRFLTEDQYDDKVREAKAKQTKTNAKASVHVAESQEQISASLAGAQFVVLRGQYTLRIYGDVLSQAHEEGWFDEANRVSSELDVQTFIRKHGGEVLLYADKESDQSIIVLGGTESDAKVSTLSKIRPVVRWTFVYASVCNWLSSNESQGGKQRIKKYRPALLEPTVLDYLAAPRSVGTLGSKLSRLSSRSTMRRALEITKKLRGDHEAEKIRWQHSAINVLASSDRWVVGTSRQCLWPYSARKLSGVSTVTVLYPDLFVDFEGGRAEVLSDRVSAADNGIAASTILARAMGAQVSNRLDVHTTHVICHLRSDTPVPSASDDAETSFVNRTRGQQILRYLDRIGNNNALLVSSEWIRKHWANQK